MAQIAILQRKCTGCGLCQSNCPFGAIDMTEQGPELNAACKVCGICVKSCPQKAIVRLETKSVSVDKSGWNDILVFAEFSGNRLHPGPRVCGLCAKLPEQAHQNHRRLCRRTRH